MIPQQFTSPHPSIFPTTFTSSPPFDLSILHHLQELTPCISNNSTSDEADLTLHDERKQRRMLSNRESARRSRMRKQRHLDELWSQVLRLRTDNHNLIQKLNDMADTHDRVLEENARLKEETKDLQKKLMDLQVDNSYSIFSDLDELSCNSAHLHNDEDSSNHSLTPSTNLPH